MMASFNKVRPRYTESIQLSQLRKLATNTNSKKMPQKTSQFRESESFSEKNSDSIQGGWRTFLNESFGIDYKYLQSRYTV